LDEPKSASRPSWSDEQNPEDADEALDEEDQDEQSGRRDEEERSKNKKKSGAAKRRLGLRGWKGGG
jgi:hypothetical protein